MNPLCGPSIVKGPHYLHLKINNIEDVCKKIIQSTIYFTIKVFENLIFFQFKTVPQLIVAPPYPDGHDFEKPESTLSEDVHTKTTFRGNSFVEEYFIFFLYIFHCKN